LAANLWIVNIKTMKIIRYTTLILATILSIFSMQTVAAQNVGIKTTTPTANLDINGTLRFRGGTPGAGKLLVSDALGNASWKERKVAFRAKGIQPGGMANIAHGTYYRMYFAEESYDHGDNFNLEPNSPDRSIFTAPVGGIYHFSGHVQFNSTYVEPYQYIKALEIRLRIKRNNVTSTYTSRSEHYGDVDKVNAGMQIDDDIRLFPGDQIWLEIFQINEEMSNLPIRPGVENAGFACHLVYEE
jgi:hypothetical protein